MKKFLILYIALLSSTMFLQAQTKNLLIRKTDQEIKLDGVIDPVWSTADSVSDFFQLSP